MHPGEGVASGIEVAFLDRLDDEELDPRNLRGCGAVDGGAICRPGRSRNVGKSGKSDGGWAKHLALVLGYGENLAPRLCRCDRLFNVTPTWIQYSTLARYQNLVPIGLQNFCVKL